MYALFEFGYLFVALCVFVFLCVVLVNLFLKSYKPQNTLVFIGVILSVFFVNTILAYNSLQNTIREIRTSTQTPETSLPTPQPQTTPDQNPDADLDFF